MTDNFNASNGVTLTDIGAPREFGAPGSRVHEARKEYYQMLRDEELGRLRDGADCDLMVYPDDEDSDRVRVVRESTGDGVTYGRVMVLGAESAPNLKGAAARYFKAHPKAPKFNLGEVWRVSYDGEIHFAAIVNAKGGLYTEDGLVAREELEDMTRIWPPRED